MNIYYFQHGSTLVSSTASLWGTPRTLDTVFCWQPMRDVSADPQLKDFPRATQELPWRAGDRAHLSPVLIRGVTINAMLRMALPSPDESQAQRDSGEILWWHLPEGTGRVLLAWIMLQRGNGNILQLYQQMEWDWAHLTSESRVLTLPGSSWLPPWALQGRYLREWSDCPLESPVSLPWNAQITSCKLVGT